MHPGGLAVLLDQEVGKLNPEALLGISGLIVLQQTFNI